MWPGLGGGKGVWFQEEATVCAKVAAWRNTAGLGKESVSMSAVEGVKKQ